jgi:hypothetical protein
MTAATLRPARQGVLRHSRWDALLVALALAQGVLVVCAPSAPLLALGLWWNSNTIAHNFIHKPFFRPRPLNALFALYQSVLLGVPQSVWRGRHLAHHAGERWRPRLDGQTALEVALVLGLWAALLAVRPWFFLTVYAPAWVAGLALCALHGHYEHARGTVSHYGALYNVLFFNDGYHAEHHARPGLHWTRLPATTLADTPASRWPAALRWLDALSLEGLERLVLRSPRLQRFVLERHERAFRRLLPQLGEVRRVAVVGGGLFPRTLLVLRRLLPEATFVVIDRSSANIAAARTFITEDIEFVHDCYRRELLAGCDLAVFPLAFVGDRAALYRSPPAQRVVVHDWLWRRRGSGAVVSLLLFKRLNLVQS